MSWLVIRLWEDDGGVGDGVHEDAHMECQRFQTPEQAKAWAEVASEWVIIKGHVVDAEGFMFSAEKDILATE